MYLPNPDLHPTGYEPAEYLDAPFIGDGRPAERVDARPSSAPVITPMIGTPVPQDDRESRGRGWRLLRLVTSALSDQAPEEGRVYHLARKPRRWRGALGSRIRR